MKKPFTFSKAKYERFGGGYFVVDLTTGKIIATFWAQEFPVNMEVKNIPEHKLKEFVITKF